MDVSHLPSISGIPSVIGKCSRRSAESLEGCVGNISLAVSTKKVSFCCARHQELERFEHYVAFLPPYWGLV